MKKQMNKRIKKMARKVRSFFRVCRHILFDGIILNGYRKKIPVTMIIEPTNICNLKCTCCPHGNLPAESRPQGFMSRETFLKIFDHIDVPVKKICLYLHGEPFLNKDLDFFVSQTDKRQNVTTTIYSNGYNIDTELLKKVLIYKKTRFAFSMDISNKENYEQTRIPAHYEKAITSLSVIDEIFAANNRKYELTMISNEDVDEQSLCNHLFAQYKQLSKVSFGARFPWPEHFYTGNLEERILRKRNLCKQITDGISVFWTGVVSICSYDFSGKLIIGDLTNTALSKIYNSTQAKAIRKRHFLHQLNKIPVCKNCLLPRFANQSKVFIRPKK